MRARGAAAILLVISAPLWCQGALVRAAASRPPATSRAPALPQKDLQFNDQGPDVRTLQERLRQLGYFGGAVTGYFGPLTRQSVKRFQADHDLPVTGYFGSLTRRALAAAGKSATAPAKPRSAPPPSEVPVQPRRQASREGSPPPVPAPTPDPSPPAGRAGVGPRLALTFDDGPDPAVLPRILEALRERGVRATFFVVGRTVAERPELVRAIAVAGHEVENHSYSHGDFTRLTAGEMRGEIARTARLVKDLTGRETRFFRPPLGAFDAETFRTANASGHQVVLWTNIGAADVPPPGTAKLVERVLAAAHDRAVIMLHGDRPETADALPALLAALQGGGYRFATLEELLQPGGRRQGAP